VVVRITLKMRFYKNSKMDDEIEDHGSGKKYSCWAEGAAGFFYN